VIIAQAGTLHVELVQGWPAGAAASLGYTVLDLPTGATVQTRRSNAEQAGAFREQPAASGSYVATLAVPELPGEYELVLDDGSGHTRTAELRATTGPAVIADPDGLWGTVEGLRGIAADYGQSVPTDDAACERLLAQAQRDLQVHVLGWRVAPMVLGEAQLAALARATCVQAAWRLAMDHDDLVAVDAPISSIDGVGLVDRPTARISRAAVEELVGWYLIRRAPTAPLTDDAPAA
jgi:hypothetical protein